MFEILSKIVLAPKCKEYVVSAPWIASKAKAGQFIVLRVDEDGERIPLTIADFCREKGTINLVFQEVGTSTIKLGALEVGDSLQDLVGPLGCPSVIEKKDDTIVVIGGGIGVAPIYPIAMAFKEAGNRVFGIVGSRNSELLIWEERMKGVVDKLFITTDDGSYGHHGVVTDELTRLHDEGERFSLAVAIGPVPMMSATCRTTHLLKIPTVVSLNPIMLDGTGMCGACRVSVGGKTRFVCVDGPEFDGHEVDFDELRMRQRMYLSEEKESMTIYHEKCGRC